MLCPHVRECINTLYCPVCQDKRYLATAERCGGTRLTRRGRAGDGAEKKVAAMMNRSSGAGLPYTYRRILETGSDKSVRLTIAELEEYRREALSHSSSLCLLFSFVGSQKQYLLTDLYDWLAYRGKQGQANLQPASGAFWSNPGDVKDADVLVEVKERSGDVVIQRRWLEKIEREAFSMRRDWWLCYVTGKEVLAVLNAGSLDR